MTLADELKKKRGNPKAGKDNVSGFQKGKSGNPGGKPKLPVEYKEMLKEKSTEALEYLFKVLSDETETSRIRVEVAKEILDRGYGKAVAHVESINENNNVVTVTMDELLTKYAK